MKTETRHYDDGTEPDVIRRFCCDGLCQQGRDCPGAPPPAEACTELGQDDIPSNLGTALLTAAVAIIVIAVLSFLVGYLA